MAFKSNHRGIAMTTDLPSHNEQPVNSAVAPRKDRVRWIVAIHLVGVVFCLMLTLADRGLLINERVSLFFYPTAQWPFLLSLLPLPICPLLLLVEIAQQRVSCGSAVLGIIAEMLLCITHLAVFGPAVS